MVFVPGSITLGYFFHLLYIWMLFPAQQVSFVVRFQIYERIPAKSKYSLRCWHLELCTRMLVTSLSIWFYYKEEKASKIMHICAC